MQTLKAADVTRFLTNLARLVSTRKEELTQLDAAIGDGDLGLTMSKGFGAVAEAVDGLDEVDVGKVLIKAGTVLAATVPSTMGTLMGTGLMRGGKAVQGCQEVDLAGLVLMIRAFVDGVMARGKAKVGDKTLLDSLHPALEALESASQAGMPLSEAIQAAYGAALNGLEATKSLVSQHGKAACFGDQTLGRQDPGATVGAYFFEALAETVGF